MDVQQVPAALRARLGVEATDGLVELFDATREEWEAEVTSGLRVEMATGFADVRREIVETRSALRNDITDAVGVLRREITDETAKVRNDLIDARGALREQIAQGDAEMRAELLKWSFLFWIGQVVALTAILSVLLRR